MGFNSAFKGLISYLFTQLKLLYFKYGVQNKSKERIITNTVNLLLTLGTTLKQSNPITSLVLAQRGQRDSSTLPRLQRQKGVSGQRHALAAIYTRERPVTHCTGGWVVPRARLDGRKISPHRDSIHGPSSLQSVAILTELPGPHPRHYTVHKFCIVKIKIYTIKEPTKCTQKLCIIQDFSSYVNLRCVYLWNLYNIKFLWSALNKNLILTCNKI